MLLSVFTFCILIWLNLYFVFLLLSLSELNQSGSQKSLTESLLEALDEYLRISKSIRSPFTLGLMLLIWSVLFMSQKSLRVYNSSPHLFILLFYLTSTVQQHISVGFSLEERSHAFLSNFPYDYLRMVLVSTLSFLYLDQ